MKTKLTLAFMATLTSTAFAAFQAPLPEFKNEKQLAEWRAEKASGPTSQGYATEDTAFYTGKPYLASSGNYTFKYRSYDPGAIRWTSEDPSGFPDGANSNIYAPSPTSEIDPLGLKSVSVTATPGPGATTYGPITIHGGGERVVPSRIQGQYTIEMEVAVGNSGWIVQEVTFDYSNVFNDSDNSVYNPSTPPPSTYWEAWRVADGAGRGTIYDMFLTRSFPKSTHGIARIDGILNFYSDLSILPYQSPAYWSTIEVAAANGLPATFNRPLFFSSTGLSHNLTLTWE